MKQRGLVCGLVQGLVDGVAQGAVGTSGPSLRERLLDTSFDTGAPWTVVGGTWTVSGGVAANGDYGVPGFYQNITEIASGTSITVSFDVSDNVAGQAGLYIQSYYLGAPVQLLYNKANTLPVGTVSKTVTLTSAMDRLVISLHPLSDLGGITLASISLLA